jgi:hypothetical protein
MLKRVVLILGLMWLGLTFGPVAWRDGVGASGLLCLGTLLLVDWLQQRRLRTVHRGQWGRDGQ